MPISSGSYTVGSGGNYATWSAAFADITSPLTGSLLLTQISDVTETGVVSKTLDLAGFNFILTSSNPHYGDWNAGWKTYQDNTISLVVSGTSGTNEVVASHLNIKSNRVSGGPSALWYFQSNVADAILLRVHNCLFSGEFFLRCLNSSAHKATVFNCILHNSLNELFNHGVTASSYVHLDYVTFIGGTYGALLGSTVNIYNCVAYGQSILGFALTPGAASNNASGDTSAPGANPRHNITAVEFQSLNPADSNFAWANPNQPLTGIAFSGIAPVYASSVAIRGNARPGPDGYFSIGADEEEWIPAPVVNNVSPNIGPLAGLVSRTVNGQYFQFGATVTFDGVPCSTVLFIDNTELTVTIPAHAAGPVDVVVTNPDAKFGTGVNAFTYVNPPGHTAVSPLGGSTAGNTPVNITGTNLSYASSAQFGPWTVPVTVVNDNLITCLTPANPVGLVDVTVNDYGGQSSTLDDAYMYAPPPVPTLCTPNNGTIAGGTPVTISGTGLAYITSVTFDGIPATNVIAVNDTTVTCETPLHAPGVVNVVVQDPYSQQGTIVAGFTYNATPTLTDITPDFGPSTGGTPCTLTGTNFMVGAQVLFDGVPATNVVVSDPNTITCDSPVHPYGMFTVWVENPDTQVSGTLPFEFIADPTVTNVVPDSGPTAVSHYPYVGNTVIINGQDFQAPVSVTFDGTAALNVSVLSPTQIQCMTPFHGAGAVDVAVTNVGTGYTDTLLNGFTYVAVNWIVTGAITPVSSMNQSFDVIDFYDPLTVGAVLTGSFPRTFLFSVPGDDSSHTITAVAQPLPFDDSPFVIIIYSPVLSGVSEGLSELTGAFPASFLFSEGNPNNRTLVVAPQVTSANPNNGYALDIYLQGVIVQPVVLDYTQLQVTRAAASSRESDYEATGYRKSFPHLVYHLSARSDLDIANVVPPNRSFLVAADFTGGPGNDFFDQGAGPQSIGTLVVNESGGSSYLVFRPPLPDEVVYYVDSDDKNIALYRYELNRDTGRFTWRRYPCQPYRTLDGMYAFHIFDPDNIYGYYAEVLGALQYQWGYDSWVLADQYDSERVSSYYLPALAANWGVTLKWDDNLLTRRLKTRNAIPSFKTRGLDAGVVTRLHTIGYRGYAREIWINPGAKALRLTMNYNGASGNIPIVSTARHITTCGFSNGGDSRPAVASIQFRRGISPCPNTGEVAPDEGSTIQISDGTITRTFEFDSDASVLPGNIAVPYLPYEEIEDTFATFAALLAAQGFDFTITDISIVNIYGPPIRDEPVSSSSTGCRDSSVPAYRSDFVEIPHGNSPDNPCAYWPSSRVSIHLMNRSGEPIDIPPSLKARIFEELRFDVLPAHVDIAFFATDVSVGAEEMQVEDVLNITEV